MYSAHTVRCLSIANKVAMLFGQVTFANVVALLTATGLNATPHPTGMTIGRYAAMVIATYRAEVCEPA